MVDWSQVQRLDALPQSLCQIQKTSKSLPASGHESEVPIDSS